MNLASEQFANTSKNFSKVTFAVTDGTLTITPKSIIPDPENPKNTMSVDSPAVVVYNGQDQTWTPVVKDGERKLEPGKDYTVEYSTADRTNVTGEITVTIKGINNYSGEVKRTYQITKRPVELKSEGGSKPYDGTALVKPGGFWLAAAGRHRLCDGRGFQRSRYGFRDHRCPGRGRQLDRI